MELCREVGVSIEAIARPALTTKMPQNALCSIPKIDQLQEENNRLSDEVSHNTNQIRLECQAREEAEAKIGDLEGQLFTAREREDVLTRQNQQLSLKVGRLTKRIGHSDKEVKRVLSRLCRLDKGEMGLH